jgi:long-chain acyl-CoA synthetase
VRASLLDSLDDFERWGKDCAYVFPRGYRRERWSYARVAAVAYQFARELGARNIVKGDAVLLWGPNGAEWVAAFLGCALCGVIAVPVDDAANADFARRISAQVRTKLVLCSRERANIFENVATIPTVDPEELAGAVARHSAEWFRPTEILPSDTLEIVFTSGTTSEPKGVVLTHANVVGNLVPIEREIKKYLKYERLVHPIRFLNLLPLSHVFGQFLGIFLPPLLGGTVVFENTFNPTEVMATIRRERVSVLVAVPRMIESLKQKVERDLERAALRYGVEPRHHTNENDFATRLEAAQSQHFLRRWWTFRDVRRKFGWKFWAIISGGAALDQETEEFWHRLGYAVVQGYGLTETTSLISLNHPFHTSRGSIGKVLPGREIKLADDGEILVRGSGVASGYWNGRELAPVTSDEDEGWYRTGDLGTLDDAGNLFFKGRKKEVIVTAAGMNVYPEDLEAALRRQKEVRDCVVVGLERGGNAEACAVVILRDGSGDASSIVARANESLAEYQRMRRWYVWPGADFPRSATQKVRRGMVGDVVVASSNANSSSDSNSKTNATAADRSVRSTLGLDGTGAKVSSNTNPRVADRSVHSTLGLSSLERVELLSELEDRYQVDLSESQFADAATADDVEKLLREAIEGRSSMGGENRALLFHYPRWTLRWPTTWVRMAVHYLLARPAVFLLGWPRVTGRENLQGVRGPLLVVSNHIDDVDVGFIQTALPARLRHKLATATGGEALERLRSPGTEREWFLRIYDRMEWTLGVALLNLFPLPRAAGFRKSFAYAGEAVDRGYSVLIFPEGRHTEDGALLPFRSGVGLLVNNLRIPVLPMRIDGLFEVKKAGKKFARPGRIQVRIGTPVRFAAESDPEEIARELRAAVEKL